MGSKKQFHPILPGNRPGCVMSAGQPANEPRQGCPAIPLDSKPLTKWETREIRRRKRILERFDSLVAGGMSQGKAAGQLRQSLTTLWRWKRRVAPAVHNSGRKTAFVNMAVPVAVVKRVQRLQLAGNGNAAAWRAVAGEKICPPVLAEFLRTTGNIPPSFLKRTRVMQVSVKVMQSEDFTAMENP
jgi:hypothetical protein